MKTLSTTLVFLILGFAGLAITSSVWGAFMKGPQETHAAGISSIPSNFISAIFYLFSNPPILIVGLITAALCGSSSSSSSNDTRKGDGLPIMPAIIGLVVFFLYSGFTPEDPVRSTALIGHLGLMGGLGFGFAGIFTSKYCQRPDPRKIVATTESAAFRPQPTRWN